MVRLVIVCFVVALAYVSMPSWGASAEVHGAAGAEPVAQQASRASCGTTRKIPRTPIPSAAALPEPGAGTSVFDFEAVPLGGTLNLIYFETYARLKGTLTTRCGKLYIRDSVVPELNGRHLDFVSGEVTIVARDVVTGAQFRVLELTLHADAPIGLSGVCAGSPAPLIEHNGSRYRLTCASGGTLAQVKVAIADGKVQMDDLWFTP
ncbi:hypothetical protein [Luteibacter sp. UNCMF366Tsu5.1]|uniref:hypothetical protein n=1 Tax=Luteibacter sp. UNCMF366Tsu5.1 TaxID=1502758 RepID=UPI0009084D09|nr:hypothetical protein [Luteibacter sp. UNCMF366Tsu5.1]SFW17012.1 hypothetical protein SAMN02800691_0065 [Luteibacter sp. UNCMF366Tsu5.1]